MRGARGTPFTDLGSYASLIEAAEEIQKVENSDAGIFFSSVGRSHQSFKSCG